jgi:peptide/nickel transport system ATP-binding protein
MSATVMPMKPVQPVLDVVNLGIRLPKGADRALAVEGATLSVLPGQTLCVVGESGSGKSMIANAVMGLLPRPHVEPVAGQILFEGRDLLQLTEPQMRELRGRRIGMVFQEPMTALNPVMRIGEQIGEVFDAHGSVPAAEKRRRILAALADVGLPDPELLIDAYPFRLSGGQRQRVMIACALVLEPVLLIADEPTTALDVTTQAQILALIRELQQRRGTAVLFITHDFGVVSEIADHVVVMQTGQVVEAGPVRQVLDAPQHPYTRKLIAAIPTGNAERPTPTDEVVRVLQVQDLCKTYVSGNGLFKRGRSVQAAKKLSFELRRGETLGLVGESGSGKSSVGRCLVGLSPFDSGRILFKGRSLSRAPPSVARPRARSRWCSRIRMHRSTRATAWARPSRAGPLRRAWARPKPWRAPWSCSSSWAWAPTRPSAIRTSSRAGSASASALRVRWPCSPSCWWPTSRCRRSTCRCRRRCSNSSPRCGSSSGLRWSSSRTICAWPARCATTSR